MKKCYLFLGALSLLTLGLGGCRSAQATAPTKTAASQHTTSHRVVGKAQKIAVIVNGQTLPAHLNTSSAAQALVKRLPMTLTFRDYAGLPEKIADLDRALPTRGMPRGHAGTKGSIGYWSPDQRLVFYWGRESYYEGIHIIGRFDTPRYRSVIQHMGNQRVVRIVRAQKE